MDIEKFNQYLTEISASEVMTKRIQDLCNNIQSLYNQITINDIFICDIINNANKEYTSLWLFTDTYIIECKNFMNKDDIDFARLNHNICYINIKKNNYKELLQPTDNSNTVINIFLNDSRLSCTFYANGNNCKHAIHLFQKYFTPNMI